MHPALEPGKHETAPGRLLLAWASGEDEGSDVEEWGPDLVCISRAEGWVGSRSVQLWLRMGIPWRIEVLPRLFPRMQGSQLWLEVPRGC